MTEDERERYGQLLYSRSYPEYAQCTWEERSEATQMYWRDLAEEFITAAGLVPLANVRAIVRNTRANPHMLVHDVEHVSVWSAAWRSACNYIEYGLDERFEQEQ